MTLYERIWRGSFPKIVVEPDMPHDIYYKSYMQSYIQRDVADLLKVGSETKFVSFVRACAARTAQLLNYADIAKDVDIDQKTVKSWLSILQSSGLVYLLQPYHTNVTKRLIKTPKLYFLDTGLCSYLTQWPTPQSLEAGAMSGAILETWFFIEILKSYWHSGKEAWFYFYRDVEQREVDLLIEQENMLYPIEFKKTATPTRKAVKHFNALNKLDKEIGPGAVLCLKEKDILLAADIRAIPAGYL